MSEKKTIKERWKSGWDRHKKKVKIAGMTLVVIGGGYFLLKNWDDVMELFNGVIDVSELKDITVETMETVTESIAEPALKVVESTKESFVDVHVMNLPVTKNASAIAKARAEELGIILEPHQTIRGPFVRNIAA